MPAVVMPATFLFSPGCSRKPWQMRWRSSSRARFRPPERQRNRSPGAYDVRWSVGRRRSPRRGHSRARGHPGGPLDLDPGVRRDDVSSLSMHLVKCSTCITRSGRMTMIQAIICDFDYTLADSSSGVVACVNEALAGLGLPLASAEQIHATIGLSMPHTLRE